MSNKTPRFTRGHSCVTCYQRKVKCDGKRPCATCVKTSRATECRSARPSGPGRLSAANEQAILLRLRRYENLLTTNGIPLNGADGDDDPLNGADRDDESTLWESMGDGHLADDLPQASEAGGSEFADEDSEILPEDLLFGPSPSGINALGPLSPPVSQVFRLWQTFLDNFNPLIKLFHAPTTQQLISDAVADPRGPSASTEALLFAIYLCAVTTMTNQECLGQLGEEKTDLLRRFSHATQQALRNAQLLKSTDLAVLQALTLYLFARRPHLPSHTLWLLSGLAVRLAQTMGLHREHSLKTLSALDGEVRRRVWWHVNILDHQAGQISGARLDGPFIEGDTREPRNLSDSALSPHMRELPAEHDGVTEMVFCTVRFEVGRCMRTMKAVERAHRGGERHAAAVEEAISAFERKLDGMLKKCDESIPLHLMSIMMGRSAACHLRMWARQPLQKTRPFVADPDLFRLALQMLEYDSLTYLTKSLQPFLWHVNTHFPFQALIQVLSDLLHWVQGDDAERAWASINRTYENHPEVVRDVKHPLRVAVKNLTLKAWEKGLVQPLGPGGEQAVAGPGVAKLLAQRDALVPAGEEVSSVDDGTQVPIDDGMLNLAQFLLADDVDVDWGTW
ncbi:fungal-specific transcription factor domain-containing protein [Lasiosphaeris hirsuta]|uniref:Fungal-specific transcription factor domain-containing protein n=1 Tax=Lasiosphaeris hirsuta TaxID=260670 RepID=A0AA40ECC4_9PEZI|nr:fungal-specific transcription factor domain-containing protein [Lasiosphaeris hirsuta]